MATNNNWSNQIAAAASIITLNSGTNALSISSDAAATTVNIATGGAAKIVTLGSTNGASSLALKTGTADFTLASATGTIISALDTGEVTMPLQSAFAAYNTTAPTNVTGDGTIYTVPFNTEYFDQNNDFASNTFTAPVTGKYQFDVSIGVWTLGALHTLGYTSLVTTGGTYYSNYTNWGACRAINNVYMISCSWLVAMTAGNTAYVQIMVSGSTKTVSLYDQAGNTYFGGYLVC